MVQAAKSAHLSKSKWIAQVISERVVTEWPQSVVGMAGAWDDFPFVEEIRESDSEDSEREPF